MRFVHRGTSADQSFIQLLAAAHAGSAESRARLLHLFRPYLFYLAQSHMRGWLRQKEGVSDAVQLTLIEAQRDFGRCDAEDSANLRLWLRRILINNVEDLRRKYAGTRGRDVSRERSLESFESREFLTRLARADSESPSRRLSLKEQSQVVAQILEGLRPDYREALVLRYVDDLTFEQIGAIVHRSRGAAEQLVKRALLKFGTQYRSQVKDHGEP